MRRRRTRYGHNDLPKPPVVDTEKNPGAIIGARYHVTDESGSFGLFPGTAIWLSTTDFADYSLGDNYFVVGSTSGEILVSLELRYPAPAAGLTRVAVEAETKYVYEKNRNVATGYRAFVFPRPTVGGNAASMDMDELATLAAEHGPILVTAEEVKDLRGQDDFDNSDLVIGMPHAGVPYGLLRHCPSRASARRTSRTTLDTKQKENVLRDDAVREMKKALEKLARAMRDQLTREGLVHALDDWHVCETYSGGWGHRYRRGDDDGTSWLCRVRAIIKIHEKFYGRRAYRRLHEWQQARNAYRELRPKTPTGHWGVRDSALEEFWAGEMKARTPKPKLELVAVTEDES